MKVWIRAVNHPGVAATLDLTDLEDALQQAIDRIKSQNEDVAPAEKEANVREKSITPRTIAVFSNERETVASHPIAVR